MKKLTSYFLLSLLLLQCSPMEQEDLSRSGEVKFKDVTFRSFSGDLPNGRTGAVSDWKHIFKNEAKLEVVNVNTGQAYEVDFNPNTFDAGYTLSLPFGTYTYFSAVEGGQYSKHLPFRLEGEFTLNTKNLDLSLHATTDYGLVTVKNEYVSSIGLRHGSEFHEMGRCEDGSHYYMYVRNGLDPILEIKESFENQLITRQMSVEAYSHYHFYLRLGQGNGNANFIELALGKFELIEEGIEIGEGEADTFTDPRDGQTYRTVRIGEQIWMAENLNYETGDSWCYDEDPANCVKFGRLYSWETALTACPEGWHLPSRKEWEVLTDYLGGKGVAGGKMKSTEGWNPPNTGATNESGFSGMAGGNGYLDFMSSPYQLSFDFLGGYGIWWSADKVFDDLEFEWLNYFIQLYFDEEEINMAPTGEGPLFSCRCLQD